MSESKSIGALEQDFQSPTKHESDVLEIIYRDEYLVAINKPSGLLVHRSAVDRFETRFALQMLRDQIGQRVYPVHRLDKPTSGLLVFALSSEIARILNEQFQQQQVQKTYLAIVRGVPATCGKIDYPLAEQLDKMTDSAARLNKLPQPAITHFQTLASTELPFAVGRYPSSRYSLVKLQPKTGRKHQLRRHMKHAFHPIIGDTTHGEGRHNRFFRRHFNCHRLLLAATGITFNHPKTCATLPLVADLSAEFTLVVNKLNWSETVASTNNRPIQL